MFGCGILGLLLITLFVFHFIQNAKQKSQIEALTISKANLATQLQKIQKDFLDLRNQDQYKINKDLEAKMKSIENTYSQSSSLYERLLDLKTQVKDTNDLDSLFAESLNLLGKRNYSSASADLKKLADAIQKEQDKLVSSFTIPANIPASNIAPGSGFSQQTVNTDTGSFLVSIVAADLNATRVIVDTA